MLGGRIMNIDQILQAVGRRIHNVSPSGLTLLPNYQREQNSK